jgi:hypothetical protein
MRYVDRDQIIELDMAMFDAHQKLKKLLEEVDDEVERSYIEGSIETLKTISKRIRKMEVVGREEILFLRHDDVL